MTPYWTRVIERAKQRKKDGLQPFTEHQQWKAGEWVTCACGKQDPRIPRFTGQMGPGQPVDTRLKELGMDFYNEVNYGGSPYMAEKILARIERRSAQILKEITK